MKALDSSVVLPNAFRGACAMTVGRSKDDDEVSELCGRENGVPEVTADAGMKLGLPHEECLSGA